MRTSDGFFTTAPCTINDSNLEIKGELHKLYRLRELSAFKFLYFSLPIVIVPICIFLTFPIISLIAEAESSTLQILYYILLCLTLITAVTVSILSYTMFSRYRGQWVANETKPIYIEKTDDDNIESFLTTAKEKIVDNSNPDKQDRLNQDGILMIAFILLAIVLGMYPPHEDYDQIFFIPLTIGAFFGIKKVKNDAIWK